MQRLTLDKETSQMNMIELACNSCYIKDGKARYRDYETDIDARELIRKLLKEFADGDDAFESAEDFENYIADCLQYRLEDIEGLIAVFYRNLWAMAELRQRLKYYEDKVHLCDTCKHTYPECLPKADDVTFGNGVGNDNICECKAYEKILDELN